MSLIIIEGARRSGKSFLISSKSDVPVFKFDFNPVFEGLNFMKNSPEVHYLGLGKELMLHQLNRDGFIDGNIIVDRGIITNTVWAVFQRRISLELAKKEIEWCINSGLLVNTSFVAIIGTHSDKRSKDIWDGDDSRVTEEIDLFNEIYNFMEVRGIKIHRFTNTFDPSAINNFSNFINELICVES